jgi:hypothetical protein
MIKSGLLLLAVITCTFTVNAQKLKSLKNIDWLTGHWEMEGKKGNQFEEWKLIDDNNMEGRGYKIFKKDTVFSETMKLQMNGTDIYYITSVKGQTEEPVQFKMVEGNRRKLEFENKEHDFPQNITYQWKQNDRFIVEVSGLIKGKKKTQLYDFKKQ